MSRKGERAYLIVLPNGMCHRRHSLMIKTVRVFLKFSELLVPDLIASFTYTVSSPIIIIYLYKHPTVLKEIADYNNVYNSTLSNAIRISKINLDYGIA